MIINILACANIGLTIVFYLEMLRYNWRLTRNSVILGFLSVVTSFATVLLCLAGGR